MFKKETNKYLIPVELTHKQKYKWLDIKFYEYKLYADNSEEKFTSIRFVDMNGIIVGEHMPIKLLSVYDKAALQVKNTTAKAAYEIRKSVEEVADLAVGVANEVKDDVSTTLKQTANITVGIFGKLKEVAKNKIKKDGIEK